MKFKKTLFFIILVFIYTSVAFADDYFNRITMASDGRIVRFDHSPITVYVPNPDVPENIRQAYIDDVDYALDQWSGIAEGQLKFNRVDSEDADIRICWTDNLPSGEADPLGEASLVQFDSGGFYVNVSILMRGIPSTLASMHNEIRSVILHELGHAIGLWGHSRDSNDVMYFRTKASYPTRKDKETLLKLLSFAPGSSFHENAISELKSDISDTPRFPHLHFWLGSVYADKGDDSRAIIELMYAMKLDSSLLKAADRLARIFQKEGMYQKAIAYYSKAANQEASPGLYGIIGMIYFQQKEYDKAVEYFQRAFFMDKNFTAGKNNAFTAYHLWASGLIKEGKYDDAISVLSHALELFSSRVIYYDLGTVYDSKRQYEKAIEYYKKALEVEPSFTPAKHDIATCMNNMGAEKLQSKNWQISIDLCTQAIEWDPDCWQAKKNLEIANFELGREKQEARLWDDAIKYYNIALEMNPNSLDTHIGLGDSLYEKGMYNDAIKHYQMALNIDPNLKYAKDGVDYIKRLIIINKAKVVALCLILPTLFCVIVFLVYRYLKRKRLANNGLIQPE
jgi:tetratricopeptide (TPR) repeat protein